MKNLVIVESPAKAKTIEKYLGKDFTVRSSFGHIRDLPKKGLNIDIEAGFKPNYAVPADKKKVVSELKKLAKTADTVWLASDEDREGEAIAWHLYESLGLTASKTKRIVFHEITEPAIKQAIANPRQIDQNLVNAQQARRVLDRLVGYELSPVLWKKVRTGLSAGRVQSVAVRLIVDREREIQNFEAKVSWKLEAQLEHQKQAFNATLIDSLKDEKHARELMQALPGSQFTVDGLETKPGSRTPSAPFTTSTLQQEAARRLGFSVKLTMSLAQRLYESGHITYMRTDSLNLSSLAVSAISQYVSKQFGDQYLQTRHYQTKQKGAQEAHEAIRPTSVSVTSAGEDDRQQKLYRLIWQRAVASQMSPAKVERTEAVIKLSNRPEKLLAKGEILTFDGFMKVTGRSQDDKLLPALKVGDKVTLSEASARQTFSKPPARYSEASLVRTLEELGIGRPSTYAPTISTIQARGYVERGDLEGQPREYQLISLEKGKLTESTATEQTGQDRGKLLPTPIAQMTNDFLVKYFGPIVDFDFTATVETEFDQIADGEHPWSKMIGDFYQRQFHPLITASADVSRSETAQARELGADPKSGKPIFARFGRYGPVLQLGDNANKEEKVDFAPMPDGYTLETVTLEAAAEMFKLPRQVGTTTDGEPILANIGRFGPYVQVGKLYVSIKGHDPLTIDETTARQVIADKRETEAKKLINDFGDIKVLNGMYGPYITDGKKNAKIPKDTEPASISEATARELLAAAPEKGKGRRFGRRTGSGAKSTTTKKQKASSSKQ